jgi:hypothetical protein
MKFAGSKIKAASFLALMLFVVAGVSSCGSSNNTASDSVAPESETPLVRYINASQNFNKTSMQMDLGVKFEIGLPGFTFAQSFSGNTALNYSEDSSELKMHVVLNADSTDSIIPGTDTESWYADGYLYQKTKTNDAETTFKTAIDLEHALKQTSVTTPLELSEDSVISTEEESVDEGTKFTFNVKGDALKEVVMSQLDKEGQGLGDDLSSAFDSMNFNDSVLTAVVGNDGKLVSYDYNIDMTMEVMGKSANMKINASYTNISYDAPEISIPDDVLSYEEKDSSAIPGLEDGDTEVDASEEADSPSAA